MAYKYVLTAKELSKSTNVTVLDLRNKDGEFAWQRDPRVQGLESFVADTIRDVMIEDEMLDADTKKVLMNIESAHSLEEDKGPALDKLGDSVKALLKGEKSNEKGWAVTALLEHYSQAPGLLVVAAPGVIFFSEESRGFTLRAPEALDLGKSTETRDVTKNIYMHNDKIYLKIIAKRFPVCDSEGQKIAYLEGPVEALFELDKKKGFVLKQLETNSKILADLYMGKHPHVFELLGKLEALEKELAEYVAFREIGGHLKKYLDGQTSLSLFIGQLETIKNRGHFFNKDQAAKKADELYVLLKQLSPGFMGNRELNVTATSSKTVQAHEVKQEGLAVHFGPVKGMIAFLSQELKTGAQQMLPKQEESSSIFSKISSALFTGTNNANPDHEWAEKIYKAALEVEKQLDEDKLSETSVLSSYLDLITIVNEAHGHVGIESKLLSTIDKLMPQIAVTISILLWGKIDDLKVPEIEANLGGYLEWLKPPLPEPAVESLKGGKKS